MNGRLVATAAVSLALHGAGLAAAARLEPRAAPRSTPTEVAFEAVPPPAPAPAPAPPPPAPRAPVAAATLPPPPRTPPPPPPPNEPPPPAPPPARAVPRVGVSLSSTATSGAFAAGVGNTLYGRPAATAADPDAVRPYAAPASAAPPSRVSAQPRRLDRAEASYPAEARRAGAEGRVVLLLRIDREGRVVAARVLSEPGAGLGEAAREAALRFRFSPALLEGEPVEAEIRFTYTFVLE